MKSAQNAPKEKASSDSDHSNNSVKDSALITKDSVSEIDFGDTLGKEKKQNFVSHDSEQTNHNVISLRYPPFTVGSPVVKVILKQNLKQVSFYSVGNVEIHSHKSKTMVFSGRSFAQQMDSDRLEIEAAWGKMKVQLPCTLISKNELNFINVDQDCYRGAIIIGPGKKDAFSIVNMLEVEEYLRGVVPLEIGKLKGDAIEALKAQAVAARTYTYNRMAEHKNNVYDISATIADQVYGGVNVEYRESDLAIRLTKDLILVYNDSIANAYYHSTCGGHTANVEDVWRDKPHYAYLRSQSDLDPSDRPYCAGSKLLKWEETWSKDKLSSIVTQSLKAIDSKQQYKGTVKKVSVNSTYSCGRIKSCVISGANWKYDCGGDIIRNIFRRPVDGAPILRSAIFSIDTDNERQLKITGRGYGHGVGMCQNGAIGRARSGQSFETILQAYYHGIVICTATFANN